MSTKEEIRESLRRRADNPCITPLVREDRTRTRFRWPILIYTCVGSKEGIVDLIGGVSRIHPLWTHAPKPLLNLATDVPNTRQEETRNAIV